MEAAPIMQTTKNHSEIAEALPGASYFRMVIVFKNSYLFSPLS